MVFFKLNRLLYFHLYSALFWSWTALVLIHLHYIEKSTHEVLQN